MTSRRNWWYVYGVGESQMTIARETFRAILEPAGIAADWRNCGAVAARAPSSPSCDHSLELREVVVRLVASGQSSPSRVLGFSSVGIQQGVGSLATVLVDRVEVMADRTQSEAGKLLGRVVAHEVGHLLLGTAAHSATGLMRAHWNDEEARRDHPMDWLLSWADARQVRQALIDRPKRLESPALRVARSAR